ncbi:MAG: glutaminyl-peptide cyclotransferase [Bacteroidetes bacterium]|nr:glutaminyl-peptide cyclotransferase [Bacteroidota bacterium]
MKKIGLSVVIYSFIIVACNNNEGSSDSNNSDLTEKKVPFINFAVVKYYPHDTTSYTEGFLFHGGHLYESTGYDSAFPSTRSLFGRVDSLTGKINVKAELDKHRYFGEGIVFLHDKVYQLTYKTKVGFIYDAKTFKQTGEFTFPSDEGWGMTTDGSSLIMSDGTGTLTYLDPENFKVVRTLRITDENGTLANVNELEMIHGFIYANVYEQNYIIRIDPATGNITGKINLASLAEEARQKFSGSQQLNGIAYDSVADKIYVTGKLWPDIYEISFSH